MTALGRRQALRLVGAGAAGLFVSGCTTELPSKEGRHVVVIGGGFGGTIAAKSVRALDPSIEVTLIERRREHVCCPFSNYVLVGQRPIQDLTITYETLCSRHGIRFVQGDVTAIDPDRRKVVINGDLSLRYDRLILSPGIDFRSGEIEGYDPAATPLVMPHAWVAGEQTLLLKRQIEAMPDGGTVLITIPPAPIRCPSGPYERVSLVAEYLRKTKPRSKVLVLDSNQGILSLEDHFKKVWSERFAGMIDYHPGEKIVRLAAEARTLVTGSGESVSADVVNLIPSQQAGAIARKTGLAEEDGGWCPVDPDSFESRLHRNIHVIGDSAMAGVMPKSGYSANCQAKACAMNVVALMNRGQPVDFSAINVCYIGLSVEETVSFAAVYKSAGGEIVSVPGAGGVSPVDLRFAKRERADAESWLRNILAEMST